MFNWAVDQTPSLVTTNPVRDVKRIKYATDGFHTWTGSEIEAFEHRHPVGTRARLAMALLLFTGVRRSDLVRLGPEHVVNGWLRFVPHKTRKKRPGVSEKPWLPVLAEIVAASPCGKKTFLETNRQGPFRDNAFSSWFRARCAEAGIPHCTAHGLRKAGAARAESGATLNQLMAVFDWLTPAMAKIYTDKADRKRMLGQAVALLSEKRIFLATPNVPPARVVVSHRRQALENVGQNQLKINLRGISNVTLDGRLFLAGELCGIAGRPRCRARIAGRY